MVWQSKRTYPGTGAQTDFVWDVPYLAQGDVFVYLDGVQQVGGYSFPDKTTVRFTAAPGNGVEVTIRRKTDRSILGSLPFGSTPSTADLNRVLTRVQYICQEAADAALEGALSEATATTFDALGHRIVNLASGTDSGDAVNKGQLDGKQPLDATLTALAAITTAADKLIYATGTDAFDVATLTAASRTLLAAADAAAWRTGLGLSSLATLSTINNSNWSGTALSIGNGGTGATAAAGARTALGLAIGTDVQAADATLTALGALTTAADKLIYATGADAFATTDLTSFARSILGGVDAASVRTLLGLGSLATLSSINDSNWSGTALSIVNGGTGQITANAALNALLPSQTSNSGKYLTTNGTDASWGTVAGLSLTSITDVLTGTDAAKAVTADALAALWEKGTDIASAATIHIPNTGGGYFVVTGTTTITAIADDITPHNGRMVRLRFSGALTLTHNATSLILPGSANITTAAGDVGTFVTEDGTNWRCISYNKADGTSVVAAATQSVLVLQDQKSSGTDGGTSTGGAWTTRTLNTKVLDTGSISTLSSNQFTLPAGTYTVNGFMTFANGAQCKARIRNMTDGALPVIGQNGATGATGTGINIGLTGAFTIAATKTFELQYWSNSGAATTGLGQAVGAGTAEVYASLTITKVA